MIRIGFGVTQFARGSAGLGIDGIGHYTHELGNALSIIPDVDIFPFSFGYKMEVLFCKKPVAKFARFDFELLKGMLIPSLCIKGIPGAKIDLIHATDHLIPFVKSVPLVATLMDAIPLSNPECVGGRHHWLNKVKLILWKMSARRADHIITISEYSKTEISRWFDIPLNRISVIPLGVDSRFFEVISTKDRMDVLNRHNVPKNYFLSVGTLQPRKNLSRVLAAMRMLPDAIKKETPLVIVGRVGWDVDDLLLEIEQAQLEGWCIKLDRISDFDLRALLQSANALVFPSLAEGFGLPVLEAFASRTLVITSNTTSLPEVSNGAAILIDPLNVVELSEALIRVLNEKDSMQDLIERGYKNATSMTWARCAEKTVEVYRKLALGASFD